MEPEEGCLPSGEAVVSDAYGEKNSRAPEDLQQE
jgi:hypothetical protein